jgi:hypothetical protein
MCLFHIFKLRSQFPMQTLKVIFLWREKNTKKAPNFPGITESNVQQK